MRRSNLTLEVEKLRKEFYESLREAEERAKRIEEQQRRTDRQLGKFVNSFGEFVESIAAPSIPKVMKRCGITVLSMHRNSLARRNGAAMEVDVLCLGRQRSGAEVVLITEIKSKAAPEDVETLAEEIEAFPRFFPEYGKRPRIGLLAGVTVLEEVVLRGERLGFYVLGPAGETLRLLNKKGFKPKLWGEKGG